MRRFAVDDFNIGVRQCVVDGGVPFDGFRQRIVDGVGFLVLTDLAVEGSDTVTHIQTVFR